MAFLENGLRLPVVRTQQAAPVVVGSDAGDQTFQVMAGASDKKL
jgi:hypothetical protein